MKHLFLIIILLTGMYTAGAQDKPVPDTQLHVTMHPVLVSSERQWANDTIRYKYNQMKYYVTTILPYLEQAVRLFNELDAKINDPNVSKKERKAFVNTKEDELRVKFEDEVKKLNETQGMLLVKLIGRQTGVNIYSMLQEFKNPLTAVRWQTWARLNGFNLNKRYNPDDEPQLERIMEHLGYPLPPFYEERTILTAN